MSPFVPVPFGISWDKGHEIGDKWGHQGTKKNERFFQNFLDFLVTLADRR